MPSDLSAKEDLIQTFWVNRWREIRRLTVMFNTSNIFYSIEMALDPLNTTHFILNLFYTIVSIIIYVMLGLSFKNGVYNKLIYPAFLMMWSRMIMDLADIEDCKFLLEDPDNPNRFTSYDWLRFVVFDGSVMMVFLAWQLTSFGHTKITVALVATEALIITVVVGWAVNISNEFSFFETLAENIGSMIMALTLVIV